MTNKKVRLSINAATSTDLAVARFAPLRTGKRPISSKTLSKTFEASIRADIPKFNFKKSYHQKLVERSIAEALRRGWVRVEQSYVQEHYKIDDFRQDQLKEKFRGSKTPLGNAIVINIDRRYSGPPPLTVHDPSFSAYSTKVHQQLGHAIAAAIGHPSFIRDNDRIVLGSGRAVSETVLCLRDNKHRYTANNVHVGSMTGSIHVNDINPKEVFLDSDTLIRLFADLFEKDQDKRIHLDPIQQSIVHANPANCKQVKGLTWFSTLESNPPDIALCGVGAFTQGHRMYDSIGRSNSQFIQSFDKDTAELLRQVVNFCDLVERANPGFSIIADIANRLFPVTLKRDIRLTREQRRQWEGNVVRGWLHEINERLVTLELDRLSCVKNFYLIAGTKKAPAIYTLLTQGTLRVATLCLDSLTAQDILDYQPSSNS